MSGNNESKISCKIWLEFHGKPIIGKGGAEILAQIDRTKSISAAAKNLHMSYRYVWNYLKRVEKTLGEPVVETYRGGRFGGGGAQLTNLGRKILAEYTRAEEQLKKTLAKPP